jgi:voltage-gated sodium channel
VAKPNGDRPKRKLAELARPRDRGAAASTGPANLVSRPQLRRFVESAGFVGFTLGLIALNAFALGVEAVPALGEPMAGMLDGLFAASTAWFIVEIALRMLAHGKPLAGFFRDGWNLFDTVIVVVSLLPLAGGVAIVARLARLLRLFRLVSGTGLLRGFVEARLPPLRHLLAGALLLALSIYTFALAAFHLAGGVLAEGTPWADLAGALRGTLAWSVPLAPPPLPAEGAAGVAWGVLLGVAHLAWLGLVLRGLWPRRGARA